MKLVVNIFMGILILWNFVFLQNFQVFGVGQKYRAFLKIVMPDSISNRDIGEHSLGHF